MLSPVAAIAQDNDPAGNLDNVTSISENVGQNPDEIFDQSWFEKIGSPVDFDDPEWLAALALLIPFYMLMRSIPPKPKEEDFPFIRLLLDLNSEEQEADNMPWWQMAINMAAITSFVVAAADPKWLENPEFTQDGSVVIAVDNDWAAAPHWEARI
ncbi:MAG: BatA domain-containing protein, partial [Alphaproteobacteria bacterium]